MLSIIIYSRVLSHWTQQVRPDVTRERDYGEKGSNNVLNPVNVFTKVSEQRLTHSFHRVTFSRDSQILSLLH